MILRNLLFLSSLAFGLANGAAPETIFINGNLLTADRSHPYAQAFAVSGDRITAVGTNAAIGKLASSGTKVVDLKGSTVTPGFNDAHVHARAVYDEDSPHWIPSLAPESVKTMAELVATLKRKAARTPKGQLVSGTGYQDTKLGRHPTRRDLDQVSTEHPIAITHSSGHVSSVNSYVLEHSGITRNTPDPAGGAFDREADGEPNGVVRESARGALGSLGPAAMVPEDAQIAGVARVLREYAERGITSVNVAGVGQAQYELMRKAVAITPTVRVGAMIAEQAFDDALSQGIRHAAPGTAPLYWSAVKIFHGNSMSGRTCWVSEEYADQPGYFGIPPARTQAELDALIAKVHKSGFQAAVHSNGDREIDMVITAIERAQKANPRPDARHRIEHASVMTLPLLARAKAAGIILVFHSYMWEHGDKLESYGSKRLELIHPHRTALDMGIHLAGHSDAPVSAAHPLLRIQDMVTRKGENGKLYGGSQRTTVEEAIGVFTMGGAYSTFEESTKGSLTPGKYADFVILAKDPRRVPPDSIKDIPIEATWVAGKAIYRRGSR